MKIPNYKFQDETRQRLNTILKDPSRIKGLMGEDRDILDDLHKKPGEPSLNYLVRLRSTLQYFEKSIRVVVDQSEEMGCPSYAIQAEGEVIATLICMRELWNNFPELWMLDADE